MLNLSFLVVVGWRCSGGSHRPALDSRGRSELEVPIGEGGAGS